MRYLPLFFLALAFGAGCATANTPPPESALPEPEPAEQEEVEIVGVEATAEETVTVEIMDVPTVEVQDIEEDVVTVLQIAMTSNNFSFSPNAIKAKPGQDVEIAFDNTGAHTFSIDEIGLDASITDGSIISFTAPTTPGNYRFYCSLGSHAALGMEGVLSVE